MQVTGKPRLSLLRIIEMNVGFFGLQFSFGLQQANMGPIYGFLGADEATMPLLWLAGPMTGLLVQPIIGAMSDRTHSRWGRRTPYFLIGAIICSISLFLMPYSSALWMAASLLWILDAGNNITMEPYRAYVADRLVPDQRATGFLTQSAFTGLAQTLSYLAPTLLTAFVAKDVLDANGIPVIVKIAFIIGAILVNGGKTIFTGLFPAFWLFALGGLFVAVTLFLPKGIVGTISDRFSKKGNDANARSEQAEAGMDVTPSEEGAR